ncbi:MAG: phage tail tape measure protein [Gammaproteobacteria bacterium]|nr:phage tail tape measure protein [Gammaproteobacteria bacterium]
MGSNVDIAALAIRVESLEAQQAKRRLDDLAESGGKAERATDLLSAGASRLAASMAGLFTIGVVVQHLKAATDSAGKLQTSLNATAAITGFTGENFAKLERATRELSVGTIFSAEQIGAAFRDIAADAGKLGDTPEKLADITRAVELLATATRSELPDAAAALTGIMKLFEDGRSAQAFVEVVVTLGASASELQKTTAAMAAAGPTARAMGVSFEEAAGSLSVLADAGIEGSEAGAGLAQVMRQLDAETNQSLRPSVVGLTDALRNASAANIEFEGRTLAVGTELVRNATAMATATEAMRHTDAATRLATEATKTYEYQLAQLGASLATLKTTVGTALIPTLTEAATAMNRLFTVTQQLADLPPLFPPEDVAAVDRMAESITKVDHSLAGAAAEVAKLGVGLSVLKEFLSLKIGDGFSASLDEIFRKADERTAKIDSIVRGPITGLTSHGPSPHPLAPAERTPLPQAAPKLTEARPDNTANNELAAGNFLAQAQLATTEDPIAKLQILFDQELAAYDAQGKKLVELGVLSEDQRAEAVSQRQAANQETLLQKRETLAIQHQATLLDLTSRANPDEFEAERQRLDASLQMRQEDIIAEAGSVQAGMDLIAAIKDKGYADIAKREQAAADVAKALAVRERQEKLSLVSSTMTGVALLVGAGGDKVNKIQRATALANVLINVPETASDAYKLGVKAGGPILGAAWAAVSVAAQLGYVSQLGGSGGGGGVTGGSAPSPSAPQYAANQTQKLYDESSFGDSPTVATARQSDQFQREQLVKVTGDIPSSVPVSGGPIPVDRPTLVIDEPSWQLPELTVTTPVLTAKPAAVSIATPSITLPQIPAQQVTATAAPRPRATISSVPASTPEAPAAQRTDSRETITRTTDSVSRLASVTDTLVTRVQESRESAGQQPPTTIQVAGPQISLVVPTIQTPRVLVQSSAITVEAGQTAPQPAASRDTITSLVERLTESRTVIRQQESPGVVPGRLAVDTPTLGVQPTTLSVDPAAPLEFNAPTLELTEPRWTLPALNVETPVVRIEQKGGTLASPELPTLSVTAPTIRAPQIDPLTITSPELRSPKLDALRAELPEPRAGRPAYVAPRFGVPDVSLPDVSRQPAVAQVQTADILPFAAPAVLQPAVRGSIKVEIINNLGVEATADITESGVDTERLLLITLSATAKDIAQNGQVGQAIAARYGLQQRLGYRG